MNHPKLCHFTLLTLLTLLLGGCGGAVPTPLDGPTSASERSEALDDVELAKLGEELRARVEARDAPFPVRVTFTRLPSNDDLTALMLVRYERVAIGRVDLVQLERIAARADVQRITLLTGTGYDDSETDDGAFDDDDRA